MTDYRYTDDNSLDDDITPGCYRKKPVEIEAMRWPGGAKAATPVIDWVLSGDGTARYHEAIPARPAMGRGIPFAPPEREHIAIDTLEGTMRAEPGDWVIRGVKGEFYPCKPDIFEATYDLSVAEGSSVEAEA